MKTSIIIIFLIILLGIGACSTEPETTSTINNTTETPTSTSVTPTSTSTRLLFEILAAANAEVMSVKIANQAYAAEHEGKYASNSGQLSKYLNGTPDATYFFNTDSGAITKVVKGDGITEPFRWDNTKQMWQE